MLEKIEKKRLKLYKLNEKQEKIMEEITNDLQPYFDFDIGITYLAGDGFAVINDKDANVVMISDCLKIIKNKGKVTIDDFEKYTF